MESKKHPYSTIRRKDHFNYVFSNAKRVKSPTHYLYIAPPLLQCPSLCIVANRKVGNAVQRNRCKRRLREFFRVNQLSILRECDMIVVVHSAMVHLKSFQLHDILVRQLEVNHMWRVST